MISFATLRAANERRRKEWDPKQSLSRLFYATALAGEVGELCNVVKKMERDAAGVVGSRATLEELAEELADIVIYADVLALTQGIDLGAVVLRKFNKTSEKYGLDTRMHDDSGTAILDRMAQRLDERGGQ